jgi:glyoxylase-like metal-dependent hydrolase (beta-lactamase superfamily II)
MAGGDGTATRFMENLHSRNLAPEASILDLNFCGYTEGIASFILEGDGQIALVDCGPSSCLPTLRAQLAVRGLSVKDLSAILLTHIHFDHAGASGTLIRENPNLAVYVHEIGAKHLNDPSRLLKSAARLWGDSLQQIFGEFVPVPTENIHILNGGEDFNIAGRKIEVAYTPGHAAHHVSYFDQSTGTAFTGDVTGLRLPGFDFVAPLTPPPDIDLDAWDRSLAEIEKRNPARVFLTHFGPYENVREHLRQTREGLHRWAGRASGILAGGAGEEDQLARFVEQGRQEYIRRLPAEAAVKYATGANAALSWQGLARYWRKRAEAQSA